MNSVQQIGLIILDGWGYSAKKEHNAIAMADPKYFNFLWKTYPHALFQASGTAVGLMPNVIGTSEIGHLTIGTGRITDTDLVRISKAVNTGEIEKNTALRALFSHVKLHDSTLHFMGLLSPGGVHAYQDHLFALLRLAHKNGISRIIVHVFLDGRDTPPTSGEKYVRELEKVLKQIGVGKIGTLSGRYYAMDRDTNWDRTALAVKMLLDGEGRISETSSASETLKQLYKKGETDEFVKPTVIHDKNGSKSSISKNDGLLFYNFRPDRARQITKQILEKADKLNLYFATVTQYSPELKTHVLFPPEKITETLSDVLSAHHITQAHIAETEKYAHVTYFLNGGNEKQHAGEEFILIDSRKDVATHDQAPHMRAKEIADATIDRIDKGVQFLAINFANADMVGHSGKMKPTIEAVSFLDTQMKRVVEALLKKNGVAFITADHGNAEEMYNEKTHEPITAHSLNPVPGILTIQDVKLGNGGLSDIAPTILDLFGINKPKQMTGESLIKK